MEVRTSFVSRESDIYDQLTRLAQECESWWACVGWTASGLSAPLWRIILDSEKVCLPKLEHAIVGLSPLFGDMHPLRKVHERGALRVVLSAQGVYEPNIYAFRMRDQYATMVISGMDAPTMFGQSNSVAVLTQCPKDDPFALAIEAFLFSCKDMARLMTLGEIETLEKRIGSAEELLKDREAKPKDSRPEEKRMNYPLPMPSKSAALALFGGKEGLYAVEAESGNLVWLFKTDSPVASSPLLRDEKVFFGCHDGTLRSVDLETGQVGWTTQTNEKSWSGFAVDHSVLCYAGSDKAIHALDTSNGHELWNFPANSRIPAAPTISDWTVYFGDSFGRVYAVDIETGSGKCLYEKKDFWNYSIAVRSQEPIYWSASQIAKRLTERLGVDNCNALRIAMGIKGLTGSVSSQMVNDLLKGMGLQCKDEGTNEWCLGQDAKRIGTRTVIRKPDGSNNAYIRWKEEVTLMILLEIYEKISQSE
jgi:hypothetical protein